MVDDVAYVGFVDPHTERDRRDDQLNLPFAPLVVPKRTVFRLQSSVVERDLLRFPRPLKSERLDQLLGRLLAVLLRQAMAAWE